MGGIPLPFSAFQVFIWNLKPICLMSMFRKAIILSIFAVDLTQCGQAVSSGHSVAKAGQTGPVVSGQSN